MDRSNVFPLLYLALLLALVLAFLCFGSPDDAVKALLIAAATAFIAKIQTVYDFLFGSSAGSKAKDSVIAANSKSGV